MANPNIPVHHEIFGGWEIQTKWNFAGECMICEKKNVLVKKMFIDGLNMALPQWAWVEKTIHRVETLTFRWRKSSGCSSQWSRSCWQSSGTSKNPSFKNI